MVNVRIIPSNDNRILHPDPYQLLLIIYDEICVYLDRVFTLIVRGPKASFWKLRWATCHFRHCTGLIILFKIKHASKNVPYFNAKTDICYNHFSLNVTSLFL